MPPQPSAPRKCPEQQQNARSRISASSLSRQPTPIERNYRNTDEAHRPEQIHRNQAFHNHASRNPSTTPNQSTAQLEKSSENISIFYTPAQANTNIGTPVTYPTRLKINVPARNTEMPLVNHRAEATTANSSTQRPKTADVTELIEFTASVSSENNLPTVPAIRSVAFNNHRTPSHTAPLNPRVRVNSDILTPPLPHDDVQRLDNDANSWPASPEIEVIKHTQAIQIIAAQLTQPPLPILIDDETEDPQGTETNTSEVGSSESPSGTIASNSVLGTRFRKDDFSPARKRTGPWGPMSIQGRDNKREKR